MPESQVERGELFVAPCSYASTFEDQHKVVQNTLDSNAFVGDKRQRTALRFAVATAEEPEWQTRDAQHIEAP